MSETFFISAYDAQMLAHTDPSMASGPWTYVAEQDEGSSRWRSHHTLVVRHEDGSYWGLHYAMGLTEYQDHELPWEGVDDDKQLLVTRLYPHEVRTVEYRRTEAAQAADDLIQRAEASLVQCGICDFGVLGPCACPSGDPRSVIADLVAEVQALRGRLEGQVAA